MSDRAVATISARTSSTRPTTITGFLGSVRGRLYRHEARRALAYGIAGVAGLALAMPVLGNMFATGSRAIAVALLGVAGVAASIVIAAAIVVGVIAPRRRLGGDAALARWVGARRREVASDLLSAVELVEDRQRAPSRPGAPSRELVTALVDTTTHAVERIEPQSLLPADELVRARRWALGILLANALALVIAPAFVATGWRSLVSAPPLPWDGAQLSNVPLVGDLEARLEFPAYSKRPVVVLPSSSGDLRGLPGTVATLRARALVPAASAQLVIESETGEPQKPIPAVVTGDQITAKLTIERTARYRFAITEPSGARSIEAAPRAIEIDLDQPPAVQLMAPGEPLDVTNLRRIELAFVIEDDFGLGAAELVWEGGRDRGKKPLQIAASGSRAQGKFIWDIAEISVPSGGEVRYWIEASDNATVNGPNVGRSRELHLRVVSPRERHEETLGRQQELAEKIVKNLAARLTLDVEEPAAREEVMRGLREATVELVSIAQAFEKDPHASEALRKSLAAMRERLERLNAAEQRLAPKALTPGAKLPRGAFAAIDPRAVSELEDDTITLADWLDRERMEGLLDVSDEIAAHGKRLAELFAQYERTKDRRLLDEIERELRALDKAMADLESHRRGMPEDVLDQYVNSNAVQAQQSGNCVAEVRRMMRAGQVKEAAAKLEACRALHDKTASALENSLAELRGDKFSDEQKKLDEVMNELADVAKDQEEIAAEANRIFEAYAEKADELAKDNRREAEKIVAALVDKLRRRLKDVDESGLTPFAKEELEIVERRLSDVEHMVADGDLAEALGMAHQAKQSLDTIASELEAAIEDDPKSKWADATQSALDGIEKAAPVARELITELQNLAPRPDQIMSDEDQRALERLRRREAMNRERTKRLGERTKQMAPELPGDTGAELSKKLGGAVGQMVTADERMKAKDPSGTREATRAASDALQKARDRARSAARQAQEGNVADEPIKIPGADEYRAPERFREDILEAMKKKGQVAPDGYDEQIKRYYEELVK